MYDQMGDYKNGKWAEELISLQNRDGTWGNRFHSLCSPNKRHPLTTEQALRRLKILGFTVKDEPIRKAVDCMTSCLRGERKIDNYSEKSHDWRLFTKLMLSTWVRIFEPGNKIALCFAKQWANVIGKTFESGVYDETAYREAYISTFSAKPKGARECDFVDFYHLHLLKDVLADDIERFMLEYVFSKPGGIYYIHDKPIMELPKVFKSKEASQYLEAVEILSEYKSGKDRLGFVVDWLEDNKDEHGQWDFGVSAKDHLHFPLSDSWRKSSDRIKDCTYRIEKIITNIS